MEEELCREERVATWVKVQKNSLSEHDTFADTTEAESSTSEFETSAAGACSRESEMSVARSITRLEDKQRSMAVTVGKTRQLALHIPVGDLDKTLQGLREIDFDSSSDDGLEEEQFMPFAEYEMNPKSLGYELLRAEVERYDAQKRLKVATEREKCMSPRINALRARLKSVEHQRQVERHDCEVKLARKDAVIEKLSQEIEEMMLQN